MKHSSHDVRRPQAPVSLRPLRAEDSRTLAELANSRAIWLMVRDIFPHPYTEKDARAFIEHESRYGRRRGLHERPAPGKPDRGHDENKENQSFRFHFTPPGQPFLARRFLR